MSHLVPRMGVADIDRLAYADAGGNVLVGTDVEWSAGTYKAIRPGRGKVGIITRVMGPGQHTRATPTSPGVGATPAQAGQVTATFLTIELRDASGTLVSNLPFFLPDRNTEVFGATDMAAPPNFPIYWEPRSPIIVPSGWTAQIAATSDQGTSLLLVGFELDEGEARLRGYDADSGSTLADKRFGIQGGGITAAAVSFVTARTGYTVQILDIFARLQPRFTGGAVITVRQSGDDETIFKFRNDNRRDMAEWKFSPGIYLEPNEGIEVIGDTNSNGRGSVIITYRYVDNADVPGNHWWSYTEPSVASPGTTTVALVGKKTSTTLSLKYPKQATTATTPGHGRRHHVEGYCFAASKDSTSTSDFVIAGLTTGTAAGNLGVSPLSLTQTNAFLSPRIGLSSAHQTLTMALDRVNLPCPANTGILMWETLALASSLLATPAASDNDITGWHLTVWGRTLPCDRSASDNHALQSTNT